MRLVNSIQKSGTRNAGKHGAEHVYIASPKRRDIAPALFYQYDGRGNFRIEIKRTKKPRDTIRRTSARTSPRRAGSGSGSRVISAVRSLDSPISTIAHVSRWRRTATARLVQGRLLGDVGDQPLGQTLATVCDQKRHKSRHLQRKAPQEAAAAAGRQPGIRE